jgi:cardiolipin synthase (CMP-forming)
MPRWINLPNSLTLLRLALAPFVISSILAGRYAIALALFAAAGLTDVLDGAAARRAGLVTSAGAYLDPIADKCLLSGVYLALAASRIAPWWLVVLIFGRDLYILLGASVLMLFTSLRKFPPSVWGKACTFVQIGAAVVYMTRNLLESSVLDKLTFAMLWVCAAFTIWSAVHYTWLALGSARTH